MIEKCEFSEILIGNIKKLTIKMPKGYELVSLFLECDIQDKPEFIQGLLNKVKNKESEHEYFKGNVCEVNIKFNKTKIVNKLYSDIKEESLKIDTEDLLNIVNLWDKKITEYENK